MDRIFIHPCYSFELENAIKAGFEGDDEIGKYYDPNMKDEPTLEVIVQDIMKKIKDEKIWYSVVTFKVCLNEKVIGFIALVNEPNAFRLFSFAINKLYRNRMVLSGTFEWVKNYFKADFYCYLWSKNERGIKWLERCGMNKVLTNNLLTITKLFYGRK